MRRTTARLISCALTMALGMGVACTTKNSFVNWETPTVHPLDLTPSGSRLLAVNLPDNRLEVFDVTGAGTPTHVANVPVGLDPVTVRARTETEAWVVNFLSDSVSIVDLTTWNVVATLFPGDEPTDVVFAGSPQRAFVSVAQENKVVVYDPADLHATPITVALRGEDPRSLATDGNRVFVAIFQSGNASTMVPVPSVSNPSGPAGGVNPPPNTLAGFSPALAAGLPPAPPSVMIVQRNPLGRWLDSAGRDWSSFVTWNVLDHDVAVLPVSSPSSVSYVSGLMTMDMALTTIPGGRVAVVGTEATNNIRFEPNLKSTFSRVVMATFDGTSGGSPSVVDLNPQLDYSVASVPQSVRDQGVSDPRAVVWSSNQDRGYVAGRGSNNVVQIDSSGARLNRVALGKGPAGLALDEARGRLYVLNRFSSTVSVVNTASFTQTALVTFPDPTPTTVKAGRPLLYDTHTGSGLGQTSCQSCHLDAHFDAIAWDLGNPQGTVKPFDQECHQELGGACIDFHPLKGPMVTQTLIGIIGSEPLHWRGDREDLTAFAQTFVNLQGADAAPTTSQMQQFQDFLTTIQFPPNPYRNLDNSLRSTPFGGGGVATRGEQIFVNDIRFVGLMKCGQCHVPPFGTDNKLAPVIFDQPSTGFKVQRLQLAYKKTGFSFGPEGATRGFGYIHDGSLPSIHEGIDQPGFNFPPGAAGDQERMDVEAYVLSFSSQTHAAIGQQVTLNGSNSADPTVLARLDQLIAVVDLAPTEIGLIVKGRILGAQRGGYYLGSGVFQTDIQAETIELAPLLALVGQGSEITATVVPYASRIRIGVDRDEDGKLDQDEILAGTDPSDPNS